MSGRLESIQIILLLLVLLYVFVGKSCFIKHRDATWKVYFKMFSIVCG